MNFKYLIPVLTGLSLSTQQGVATLRTDLTDRSKEEVYEKAKSMAQTYQGSNAVGSIYFDFGNGEVQSAIALDPWTVLTAAHMKDFHANNGLRFTLASVVNDNEAVSSGSLSQPIKEKVRVHPDFSRSPDVPIGTYLNLTNDGKFYCDNILASELVTYTIDQFFKTPVAYHNEFSGVDLAILKLSSPLPGDLDYPDFFPLDVPVEKSLGASIGYGPMKYNTWGAEPVYVATSLNEAYTKHLISVKVSAFVQPERSSYAESFKGAHVLYGHYKGLLINGDESFVPTEGMMKTEGLPVMGDSGGPLFIKHNDKPKLAGIMSSTFACSSVHHEADSVYRQPVYFQYFRNVMQPIFPTWIDVRHYQDWIKSHMGPKK